MTDATDQRIRLLCDPAYHPARVRAADVKGCPDNPSPTHTEPASGTVLSHLQSLSNRVQRLERLIGVHTPDTAR